MIVEYTKRLLMCIALGTLFGIFTAIAGFVYSVVSPRVMAAPFGELIMFLPFAGFGGAFVGLVCGTICGLVLVRKHVFVSAKWLLMVVTPSIPLCFLVNAPALVIPVTVLLFVGTSLVLAIYLPVTFGPGHCQKCGYNLTGNVSGACPECGTPIE